MQKTLLQECTGERGTSITKFGGGFPLQARANGREDCDRNWLPDSHGTDSTTKQQQSGGALNHLMPSGYNYGRDQ